ncbi:MAG: HAD family hydrolase [Alphaproteobacteria bacterium]|nr:MAG: HAD family hydrolase [Alphaproteobacteria bacterium]
MVVRKLPSGPHSRRAPSEDAWARAEVFIFDVEGTLVDAMMPTLRCWRETFAHFGHDVSLAELHLLAGMDGGEMLTQLLPGSPKTERKDMLAYQGKHFREEYLSHVRAFPGVRALFEELKGRQRKIALATDCDKDQLGHYLRVAGIENLVDAIGCGEDVKRGKPAPDVVEVALRRVRAGRKPAVLIGDTPFDAQAALKAAVTPLGVLTGHFSAPALLEAGCHAVWRDPAALHEALLEGAERAGEPAEASAA